MRKGIVKWFNNRKGYGFITDENGMDVFVHYSEISGDGYKSLKEGEHVSFDVRTDDQGREIAINVERASMVHN